MSAVEIVELLADEDGSVNANDAIDALNNAIERLHDDGVRITYEESLGLVYAALDYVHDVHVEQIVLLRRASDVQFALISQMRGDPNAKMPEPIDLEEEASMARMGAKLDRLGRLYDLLESKVEPDEEREWEEPELPFDDVETYERGDIGDIPELEEE